MGWLGFIRFGVRDMRDHSAVVVIAASNTYHWADPEGEL